jgi:hypothetical protein
MHSLRSLTVLSLCLGASTLLGCGGDDEKQNQQPPKACSVEAQTGCQTGQVCEEVDGADPACFAPVAFKGMVMDALTQKPIKGARVVARDANDAAVSSVAISGDDGSYALNVPAKRDKEGKPLAVSYTLRADAMKYQTFPLAPRVALPIDITTATGTPPVVKSAATDVALIPLENADGLGSISGKVVVDPGLQLFPAGALVVAGGATGVVDYAGNFAVFNVTPGASVEVHAYAAGLQIDPKTVAVEAGKDLANVELHVTKAATAKVTGQLSIVNGNGFSSTSVVLALKDTFVESAKRGEVPKGLRVGNVSGAFTFEGVPDGTYKVLAAFENDGLVRDPDTNIGGTDIVEVTVKGADVALPEGFKVTGALDVKSPGADKIEEVMGTPSFVWADDSSEDQYQVQLFDALGKKVWENLNLPGVSGSPTVTASYEGPALLPGMIYQFRATSLKKGVPISQTEDLRGVFVYR